MKIGLLTWGSDGDIRPFCALAGGLAARGHDVTLAVASVDNKDYSNLGQAMGFKVIPACRKYEYTQQQADEMVLRIIASRNLAMHFKILFDEMFKPAVDDLMETSNTLCGQNDLVIGHIAVYPLFIAAEKHGLPCVTVSPVPSFFKTAFEPPEGLPNLGQWLNPILWKLGEMAGGWILKPPINKLREQNGLAPLKSPIGNFWQSDRLNLICASPSIFQRCPDWKDNIQVTGFFDIPDSAERWEIPGDLLSFLDYGQPPVYLTFGSFTQFDIERNVELMAATARLLGHRAIIQAFWENVSQIPDIDDVYLLRKVPHHQIFPRCAAVVHHGGAGTTQSSLYCGCPSIVVAHAFDQFLWARKLQQIGAGGRPLQKRTVTPQALAAVIRQVVEDQRMKQRAEQLGAAMKKENGVATAVGLIERWMVTRT